MPIGPLDGTMRGNMSAGTLNSAHSSGDQACVPRS